MRKKPQFDLLEDRAVPAVLAVNDTAATLEGNSVQVNVLANDTVTGGGTGNCMSFGTIVSVSTPGNGSATVGADVITYAPSGVGTDSFTYTIQDPVTQEQSTATVYVTTYADPYPAYLAEVATADAGFVASIESAAQTRQNTINAAADTAVAFTDAAYATYEAAVADAEAVNETVTGSSYSAYLASRGIADAAFDSSVSSSIALLSEPMYAQMSALEALASANQEYFDAINEANAEFDASIAPAQAARDAAWNAHDADPNDPNLLAAYVAAQSALSAAVASAEAACEESIAEAELVRQEAQDAYDAAVEAKASVLANVDLLLADAEAAFAGSAEADWGVFLVEKGLADQAMLDDEAAAWSTYSSAVDAANADVDSAIVNAEVVFASTSTDAFVTWANVEADAWDTYSDAMASVPSAPLGERIGEPAEAQVPPVEPPPIVNRGPRITVIPSADPPANPPSAGQGRLDQLRQLQSQERQYELAEIEWRYQALPLINQSRLALLQRRSFLDEIANTPPNQTETLVTLTSLVQSCEEDAEELASQAENAYSMILITRQALAGVQAQIRNLGP